MTSSASQRRISNVRLTRKFHYRYLGLWVVLGIALVLSLNVVLYLFAEERWGALYAVDATMHEQFVAARHTIAWALGLETLLFALGIITLAKFTAHRIAGPYIRLGRAFDAVRDGELDHRLVFRRYDRLEDLERKFADMMAAVRARSPGEPRP